MAKKIQTPEDVCEWFHQVYDKYGMDDFFKDVKTDAELLRRNRLEILPFESNLVTILGGYLYCKDKIEELEKNINRHQKRFERSYKQFELTDFENKKLYAYNSKLAKEVVALELENIELKKQLGQEDVSNKKKDVVTPKRKVFTKSIRHEVFKRDEYRCLECGATNQETSLHIDHILPVSQGGSDEMSNLQTLCRDCNLSKSNRAWKAGR
jgi:predicted restriction endonuclease